MLLTYCSIYFRDEVGFNIYKKFTFFDLTNPSAYVTGAEKPKFVERGPYVYKVRYLLTF